MWDADIAKLFALFDARGDGIIQPDEFLQSQLLVASALGLEVREGEVFDSSASVPSTVDLHHAPPPLSLARSKTIDALHKSGFSDVDVDCDGCISFDEFK